MEIQNLKQEILNLSLVNLSSLLEIIWKQIKKLGGNPNAIVEVITSFSDIEKEKWKNGVFCPWCKDNWLYKNGHSSTKKLQRYLCRSCNKSFDFMTGTFLSYSHLSMDQLTKLVQCIVLKLTCKKTGEICNLTTTNSWKPRIKILDSLEKLMENKKLKGVIWLDETYYNSTIKGNWKLLSN